MSRRTVITIVSVVAALLLGAAAGALLFGSDDKDAPVATATGVPPTTPVTTNLPTEDPTTEPTPSMTITPTDAASATPDPVLPTPAKGSLSEGNKKVLLGGKLTIPNTPWAWVEKSSDADSAMFNDESNCSESCPKIWIYDTGKGQNHVTFGDNPLSAWAKDHCHGSGTKSETTFVAGGVPAVYNRLSCEGQDYFAWWIPSKKVLVTTQDADGQIADPNIVQAALESAVWA